MCKEKKCSLAILKEEAIGPGPRCCFFGKYAFLHVRQKKRATESYFFHRPNAKVMTKDCARIKKCVLIFHVSTLKMNTATTHDLSSRPPGKPSPLSFSPITENKANACSSPGKKGNTTAETIVLFSFFLSGVVFVFFFSVQ